MYGFSPSSPALVSSVYGGFGALALENAKKTSSCEKHKKDRKKFLDKMWATPILTQKRADYEKKANAAAAALAKCEKSAGKKGKKKIAAKKAATAKDRAKKAAGKVAGKVAGGKPITDQMREALAAGGGAQSTIIETPEAAAASEAEVVETEETEEKSGFPIIPVLAGVALLAGGYFFMTRKKSTKVSVEQY